MGQSDASGLVILLDMLRELVAATPLGLDLGRGRRLCHRLGGWQQTNRCGYSTRSTGAEKKRTAGHFGSGRGHERSPDGFLLCSDLHRTPEPNLATSEGNNKWANPSPRAAGGAGPAPSSSNGREPFGHVSYQQGFKQNACHTFHITRRCSTLDTSRGKAQCWLPAPQPSCRSVHASLCSRLRQFVANLSTGLGTAVASTTAPTSAKGCQK